MLEALKTYGGPSSTVFSAPTVKPPSLPAVKVAREVSQVSGVPERELLHGAVGDELLHGIGGAEAGQYDLAPVLWSA